MEKNEIEEIATGRFYSDSDFHNMKKEDVVELVRYACRNYSILLWMYRDLKAKSEVQKETVSNLYDWANKYEEAYIEIVDYISGIPESYKKEDLKHALLVVRELMRGKK